ncbi:Membrane transport protein [Sesbania bispinosa]|nr:Membrane transport protein [Sesbania bispinosa]
MAFWHLMSAANLATLPLIIVPAICKERSKPFGDVDLGHIHAWSIVYNIVRIYSPKNNVVKVAINEETNGENLSKCSAMVPEKPNIMKQLKILADKINLKIIGLIVGVVPQFRKLLVGDSAPLSVVQDSTVILGDASVPAMILLVGANLLKGLKGLGTQVPLIVGIIVVKYFVLPIIGIGIVKGAIHFGLIHSDPLYQFVLLLHFALPPAMSVGTMTQLLGVGESECSVIMLATYSCATVLLTLWCTIFMWLVL